MAPRFFGRLLDSLTIVCQYAEYIRHIGGMIAFAGGLGRPICRAPPAVDSNDPHRQTHTTARSIMIRDRRQHQLDATHMHGHGPPNHSE
jgi:hypothetical protein